MATYRTRFSSVEQVLQDLLDRLRRIETRRTATVGDWVIEQDPLGRLVARHAPTGTVTVLASP